ncbi:MAG TPA: hypothetical protein VGO11_07810 [Chthoniobacteraceae bacterium]|nr:hypothetical protein [Chthoniobacteraceae bacterium]
MLDQPWPDTEPLFSSCIVRELDAAIRLHAQRAGAVPWQSPTPLPK